MKVVDVHDQPSSVEVISKLPICDSKSEDNTNEGKSHGTTKEKAVYVLKNGSPASKVIAKNLFKTYQKMGRNQETLEDQMELVEMYNDSLEVNNERFNSLDVHCTFKDLKK